MTKANEILTAAVATLDQRGKDYDQPGGERSMGRIVAAFNALTDHELTEAEGWQFMACLKLVRMQTAADPTDSAVDCAAYAALAGEALGKVGQAPETDGWIKWEGGECPVDGETMVEVQTRDGINAVKLAKYLNWKMEKSPKDIISYRVLKLDPIVQWIPWEGGDCPVDGESLVHVRFNEGNQHIGRAKYLDWGRSPLNRVVAYRVVSEAPAAEKDGPWRPEERDRYYFIGADGRIGCTSFFSGEPWDQVRIGFGNCFRTREEAEAKLAEIFGGK